MNGRLAAARGFDIPGFNIPFVRLFEYEERGTPKAYRIGRAWAVKEGNLDEFHALFIERFGALPALE